MRFRFPKFLFVAFALWSSGWCQRPSFGLKLGWPATDAFKSQSWPGGKYEAASGRWVLGPVFELMLPWRLSVEADLLHRSVEYRSQGPGESLVTTGRVWTLPLMGRLRLSDRWVAPVVGGGLVWQRFTGLKQTGTEPAGALPRQPVAVHRNWPRELVNKTPRGYVFALGLEGNLLGPRFIPELRYTRWRTDAFRMPDGSALSGRNQFEFILGLMF
ncbi:MAG: hypothetical protein NZ554_02395 [Bryobacteraceae bacterium]|nr:hypothetical protein [Bryobacteraceae bacterium]